MRFDTVYRRVALCLSFFFSSHFNVAVYVTSVSALQLNEIGNRARDPLKVVVYDFLIIERIEFHSFLTFLIFIPDLLSRFRGIIRSRILSRQMHRYQSVIETLVNLLFFIFLSFFLSFFLSRPSPRQRTASGGAIAIVARFVHPCRLCEYAKRAINA